MKNFNPLKIIARKVLSHPLIGIPLSNTLYQLGFYNLTKKLSKYSGFTSEIVTFSIPSDAGKMIDGKMYGITGSNLDFLARTIWLEGFENYEKPMPQVFCRLVREAKQVLDVGVNSGFYSIISALVSPDLTVHAFEPFPTALQSLIANVNLNRVSQQIKIINSAVGNYQGTAKLYVPSPRFGAVLESSASLNPEFRDQHSEVLEVPLITLDQYVTDAQLQRVDTIKIDVESQEHVVLEGSQRILKLLRPIVFLEVLEEANTQALDSIRSEANYVSLWLAQEAIIRQDSVKPHPQTMNQILCPVEKIDKIRKIADELNLVFVD
jgi:FkbM family methyltransferase